MSPTRDSTLVDPQQIIADLERKLTEAKTERNQYKAERDEALETQTATAEVLQVINSSPGDLAPGFDAMLERATRFCEPAFGILLTWDGGRFQRVAWRGIAAELIETTRQPMASPPPGAPGYRIAHGESVVCITDLAEEAASGRSP